MQMRGECNNREMLVLMMLQVSANSVPVILCFSLTTHFFSFLFPFLFFNLYSLSLFCFPPHAVEFGQSIIIFFIYSLFF